MRFRRLLPILLGCAAALSSDASLGEAEEAAPGLRLEVRLDRRVYHRAEPIILEVRVSNEGREAERAFDLQKPFGLEFYITWGWWVPQIIDTAGNRLTYGGINVDGLVRREPSRLYRPGETVSALCDIRELFDWKKGSGYFALTMPPVLAPHVWTYNRNFAAESVRDTVFFAVLAPDAGPEDLAAAMRRVASLRIEIRARDRTVIGRGPINTTSDTIISAAVVADLFGLRIRERDGSLFLTDGVREVSLEEMSQGGYPLWAGGRERPVFARKVFRSFGIAEEKINWRVVDGPSRKDEPSTPGAEPGGQCHSAIF